MHIKETAPKPQYRVSFSKKEVRKLLQEFAEVAELYRYGKSDFDTPHIDDFVALLESTVLEY